MAALKIDIHKCVGCGLCVKSCTAGALHMEQKKAVVQSKLCTLCGICTQSCRFKAISVEKEKGGHINLSLYRGIWVFAEQQGGKVLPVALELTGKGRMLADERCCKLTALLGGTDISGQDRVLIAGGADQVFMCQNDRLADNPESDLTDLICAMIEQHKPEIMLFGATGLGRSLAPRVAARMRTGLTADCTMLEIDSKTGLLCQTRPAFGGNLMATIICPDHRPQMATVRPGVMSPGHAEAGHEGTTLPVALPGNSPGLVKVIRSYVSNGAKSIADAQVIVSAGRGIGSKKNMSLVYELAELLGGEVGVSRALVDIGWGEYRQQIGQTGCSVAPKLLIACGISGAVQHLAGIGGADTVIAINKDPEARIFSASHYAVVGDCTEVLTALIKAVKASK